MGHFTEESLQKFNTMCAEGVDFGESPVYDFTRCVKPNGEAYGTDGRCRAGTQEVKESGPSPKGNLLKNRLGALKAAFERKVGREMNAKEIARAMKKMELGVAVSKGKSAEDTLESLLPKGGKPVLEKKA